MQILASFVNMLFLGDLMFEPELEKMQWKNCCCGCMGWIWKWI